MGKLLQGMQELQGRIWLKVQKACVSHDRWTEGVDRVKQDQS